MRKNIHLKCTHTLNANLGLAANTYQTGEVDFLRSIQEPLCSLSVIDVARWLLWYPRWLLGGAYDSTGHASVSTSLYKPGVQTLAPCSFLWRKESSKKLVKIRIPTKPYILEYAGAISQKPTGIWWENKEKKLRYDFLPIVIFTQRNLPPAFNPSVK